MSQTYKTTTSLNLRTAPAVKPGNIITVLPEGQKVTLIEKVSAHAWWTPKALIELSKGNSVAPAYGKTISELNANATLDWLKDFGSMFGWKRVFDTSQLQEAANVGGVGVICASTGNNKSGHITVVIPEPDGAASSQTPYQSQAGRTNRKKFRGVWWDNAKYKDFGFWVHA